MSKSDIENVKRWIDKINSDRDNAYAEAKQVYLQLLDKADFNRDVRLYQMGVIDSPQQVFAKLFVDKNYPQINTRDPQVLNELRQALSELETEDDNEAVQE